MACEPCGASGHSPFRCRAGERRDTAARRLVLGGCGGGTWFWSGRVSQHRFSISAVDQHPQDRRIGAGGGGARPALRYVAGAAPLADSAQLHCRGRGGAGLRRRRHRRARCLGPARTHWGRALGSAAFALWLFVAFTRKTAVGSLVALPVGLGAALIGCGAQVYAKLPWYSLAILAAVPLLAHLVWLRRLPRAAQALLSLVAAALPAAAAVWFTFKETGAPPL